MADTAITDLPTTTDWASHAADVAIQIAPFAAEHDQDGSFTNEAFDILRDVGFAAALVPAHLGGGGATHTEAANILRELAKGDPAVAVTLSMHYHLVATQVWRLNHGQPAEGMLRRVAAENLILISTGAHDWVNSYGHAEKVDGGFVVTAKKAPSSGAPAGDMLITSLPWPDAADGPQIIHCAIPFSAEGVSIEETWDTMGLRGTGSETVALDGVFVPDAAVSLIRPSGVWHPLWDAVLGSALPLIMGAYLGIGETAAEIAIEHAKQRGGSLAPQVGQMLNRLTTARDAVDAMLASSRDLTFDASTEHTTVTLARKTIATEALIDTVRAAMEICGGMGFSRASGLERLYRDVHGAMYHPLPAARQTVFTGRAALGLDPIGD